MISAKAFRQKFNFLILIAWIVPAVFGLSFLMYIEMFSPSQMWDILTSPIEPFFVGFAIFLAYSYFCRFCKKIILYIESPEKIPKSEVINTIQRFPLHFWSAFLLYLVIAPVTVILSAEYFSDFVATPIDWFRINLVALIVSIIVGLPIFILIMDLFGKITTHLGINKPIISIKSKVFMIGALVPLLIDTMLIQYYWTRTNYFSVETFFIWLFLELLAICGSLIFVKSFSQSLAPLNQLVDNPTFAIENLKNLQPQSTDELGILTVKYNDLLSALHKEQQALEQKVKERTAKLAEANDELTAFSYSVSHDLRAPLRHILSFSQILREEGNNQLSAELIEYIERICSASQRMSGLIDQLLRLSQVNRQNLQKEPVDLSLFVRYQLENLVKTDKNRKISARIEPDLEVMGDDNLLMIAMENLVNNAWKYTSKRDEARIEFGFNKQKHAYYLKDNGAGFNMAYADKLFSPFQRLHKSTDFEGNGIGLATVHRIIQKHNGKIWAESEPDKGATFYFELEPVTK